MGGTGQGGPKGGDPEHRASSMLRQGTRSVLKDLSHGHFNARVILIRPENKFFLFAPFPFPVHSCLGYLVSSVEEGTKPNCPRDGGRGLSESQISDSDFFLTVGKEN